MVFLIPIFGILFYFALFVAALVLVGIVWGTLGLIVGLVDLKHWITGRRTAARSKRTVPRVPPKRNVPRVPPQRNVPRVPPQRNVPRVPERAEAQGASDIWPKWNASHRLYTDREKSLWQEQFDALNSRE